MCAPKPRRHFPVLVVGLLLTAACAPRQEDPAEAYVRFHERASLAARGGSGLVPVLPLLTEASRKTLEDSATALQTALPKGVEGPTAAGMLLLGSLKEAAVPRVEIASESGDEATVRVTYDEEGTAIVPMRREQGAWKVALFDGKAATGD